MLKFFATRVTFWLFLLGIVLAVTLLNQTSIPKGIPDPVVEPPRKPANTKLAASGIVESFGESTLVASTMAGVVSEVHREVWERVEKGEPLFELDSRLARSELEIARTGLKVAEAELKSLEKTLNRILAVEDKRAISEAELEARRSEVSIAEAQVAAASAKMRQAETRVELLTVRSPRKGTVLQVNVRPGEFTAPGAPSPPILLGDTEELQIRADIDEELVGKLPENPSAIGYIRGTGENGIDMEFVRVEPLIVPKRNLTGSPAERVDTRVLQVIFRPVNPKDKARLYIGQQLDVFIKDS